MTRPGALALGIFGLTLVLTAAAFGLLLVDPIPVATEDRPWFIAQFCFAIGYGSFGVFLASRRPGNPIGWLFQAVALASALLVFADEYSIRGLVVAPGSLPLAVEVDVILPSLAAVVWPAFIPLLLTLYPTGRPASRRWWSAVWASVALALLYGPSFFLLPGTLTAAVRQSVSLHVSNPIGIPFGSDLNYLVQSPALLIPFALALLSVADRWRRSRGDERQQLNWLAAVCLLIALVLVPYVAVQSGISIPLWVSWIFGSLLLLGFAFGIPGAMAVAILRYRLYEIDVVLNRALVYGALAAFISAVYVGIVVGIGTLIGSRGQPNLGLSIAATAVVAVAFQPVRERIERVANRLVYGQRATPYEVLAQFSHRVAGAYANEEGLSRLARVLGEGTAAAAANVWIRTDGQLGSSATWPAEAQPMPPEQADRVAAVRHQGEELGELAVKKRPGEPVTPVEEKLLTDLAAQAGQVLRNVRLTADLQARLEQISQQAAELRESRQRIVAAQDAERRRLERNIHDGAQQHLVALAVKLRLAATLAKKDPEKGRRSVQELEAQTGDAIRTLVELAQDIYPPALREQGLVASLRPHATVTASGIGRYDPELEAAVYFCCLEALQNAAKHARASQVRVDLQQLDGHLHFAVIDNGVGFDPARTTATSGLQNMKDRVASVGGSLTVQSGPGQGTSVSGDLPMTVPLGVAP